MNKRFSAHACQPYCPRFLAMNYSWLCYSPSLDGALCLPCVLFGDQFPSKANRIKILFSEPMSHWSDACASQFKRGNGENKNSQSRVRVSVTKQKFLNRIVVISLSVSWVT